MDAAKSWLECMQEEGAVMSTDVGDARIGQWYLRWDKGELFQVTGLDSQAKTIEIQTFDGDVDEIDADAWTSLPLGLAEPPEDWTGPVDNVEVDDLGYEDTEMTAQDWAASVEPLSIAQPTQEEWEDTADPEEHDPEGEGQPAEPLALDEPLARERLR